MDSAMSYDHLTTYLNDHLAGAVAGLELLDHLVHLLQGSTAEAELLGIRSEVEEDRKTLQGLLHEIGGAESRVRQAAAWFTEKMGRAKLQFDDAGSGDLRILEGLETLALGIQGKAALWRALGVAATRIPPAQRMDFKALERRALSQFERVDCLRLQKASSALSF
jgi:hypothetical protein